MELRLGVLERDVAAQEQRIGRSMEVAARHEEQINGDRGLSRAIDTLTDEVKSLRRALYSFGGAIVLAAVTFALTVGQGHL